MKYVHSSNRITMFKVDLINMDCFSFFKMLDQCFKDKDEPPPLPPKPHRLQLDDENEALVIT